MEQLVEMGHQGLAQRLFKRKKADTVDPELEGAVLSFLRPLPDQFLLFAPEDLFQKGADDTIGRLVLEVFGLSFGQRFGKNIQEQLGSLGGILSFDAEGIEAGKDAGDHADNFPGGRGEGAFVKIVEIKIN